MFKRHLVLGSVVMLAACTTTPEPVTDPSADVAFDRSIMPEGTEASPFVAPILQRGELSNGLQVLVAENHELPITGLYMVVGSGSAHDPVGKEGVGRMTSHLMSLGTTSKSAVELSEAFNFIGAEWGTGAGLDAANIFTIGLNKHFDQSLALFADVVMNPSFPVEELEREKVRTLTGIMQNKDQPSVVASQLFYSQLYGANYFGRPSVGSESSVGSLSHEDVVAYYSSHFVPNNATLIVAGDVTMAELQPKLEAAFAGWEKKELNKAPPVIVEGPEKSVVYLHDIAGAPQSQIRVGSFGIKRTDDDYYAVTVMNQALGGNFQSRINLNLREEKGYTYGARSSFRSAVDTGPFVVSTGVKTEVTAESLNEIFKELRDVNGERPLTQTELDYFKGSLVLSFPKAFESTGDLLRQIGTIVTYGLSDDYYSKVVDHISAVGPEDVVEAAARINADAVVVVVVGDKEQVLAPLIDNGYEVVLVDAQGNAL